MKKNYDTSKKSKVVEEKRGEKKMMSFFLVLLYLALSVSGLILYKYGASKGIDVSFANSMFSIRLSFISILGLLCYLFSFLLYMLILPRFNLTYIMPLTSAVSYISIFVLSFMILKESITVNGIVGSIIILIGIIIMNIKK